ncbi:polymorphic toxin-type HINT domain-containing protein [Streptomyces sp. NPDC051162]|uniref:polymorphic toxin-type HINT domain-containing protein n=1 Tax=unclassified Streptomyces TaxID=2593676 RepID=UPI0034211277
MPRRPGLLNPRSRRSAILAPVITSVAALAVLSSLAVQPGLLDLGRIGDQVLATDPESGRLRAEAVSDTFQHDTEHLVDISVTGGLLTSTTGHRFFVVDHGWTTVSDLRAGDRLRAPDGTVQTVTALRDRVGLAPRKVFDLTVDGLHTFYVHPQGEQSPGVLVHNCTNIIGDEGIQGAHTLGEHVRPSDAAMYDKAQIDGIAGKWTDQATAARAVDQGFQQWVKDPRNADRLATWKRKQSMNKGGFNAKTDTLAFEWELRDEGSLGRVWRANGDRAGEPASNKVRIVLRYVPKSANPPHKPSNFVVFTSYPLPKQ